MRTRQVIRALFGLTVCAGLIFILTINFSRNFPKHKEQFLQDTISILEKGIEIVDDFRQTEKGKGSLKKSRVKTRAEEGVARTREEGDVATANGKLGMPDIRDNESMPDTRGNDSLAEESTVKTHAQEDVVDARAKEGVVETRANEGVVDTRAKEGISNTPSKEGVVDTSAKEGISDTLAKEGVVDTRGEFNVTNTRSQDGALEAKDSVIKANAAIQKRLSLIMIGHDRSGTTFINRMFNEDPNVFNVYEPLWITKGIGSPENHTDIIIDALNGILNCNFSATTNGLKFLAGISEWIAVRVNCKAMMSRPFCSIKNGKRTCGTLAPDLTDKVCAKNYKYSVTKLAVPRIPNENVSCIVERLLDENPQSRVLYMVRDPRGTINSRINAGWLKDYPDPGIETTAKSVCDTTAYNLRYMQLLVEKSEYKHRCMIIRYRDISADPLAVAKKIYNFARFEIEPRLTEWIMNHTRPSKKKLEIALYNRYSVVRNATGNADKWRKESPVERVRVINKACVQLLRLLGVSEQSLEQS